MIMNGTFTYVRKLATTWWNDPTPIYIFSWRALWLCFAVFHHPEKGYGDRCTWSCCLLLSCLLQVTAASFRVNDVISKAYMSPAAILFSNLLTKQSSSTNVNYYYIERFCFWINVFRYKIYKNARNAKVESPNWEAGIWRNSRASKRYIRSSD